MHSRLKLGADLALPFRLSRLIHTYPCLFLLQNFVRASLVFVIHNSQYPCIDRNTGSSTFQTLSATIRWPAAVG